jgi:alpha-amylase/alpha-mannosidase (GH57 family)
MPEVYHAIGLSMHQPLGNLLQLHNSAERYEVEQILWCYDRVTRMNEGYDDVARLHMMFSGTLLKQLEDPAIGETFGDIIDIPDMLRRYREAQYIEYLGTGLYHPVFPLIPEQDWDAQAGLVARPRSQNAGPRLVSRLLPAGDRLYPIDDSDAQAHGLSLRADRLHVHQAEKRDVVAGDALSPARRALERRRDHRRAHRPRAFQCAVIGHEPLVDRARDRRTHQMVQLPGARRDLERRRKRRMVRNPNIEASFWGHFYQPMLEKCRAGQLEYRPCSINEYLDMHGPGQEVDIYSGAWNTDHHWGGDFMQWTGSLLQKKGFDEIRSASDYYRAVAEAFEAAQHEIEDADAVRALITHAYDTLLVAETSCNFYWGSRWVHRSFDQLEVTYRLLDEAQIKATSITDMPSALDVLGG